MNTKESFQQLFFMWVVLRVTRLLTRVTKQRLKAPRRAQAHPVGGSLTRWAQTTINCFLLVCFISELVQNARRLINYPVHDFLLCDFYHCLIGEIDQNSVGLKTIAHWYRLTPNDRILSTLVR